MSTVLLDSWSNISNASEILFCMAIVLILDLLAESSIWFAMLFFMSVAITTIIKGTMLSDVGQWGIFMDQVH